MHDPESSKNILPKVIYQEQKAITILSSKQKENVNVTWKIAPMTKEMSYILLPNTTKQL